MSQRRGSTLRPIGVADAVTVGRALMQQHIEDEAEEVARSRQLAGFCRATCKHSTQASAATAAHAIDACGAGPASSQKHDDDKHDREMDVLKEMVAALQTRNEALEDRVFRLERRV